MGKRRKGVVGANSGDVSRCGQLLSQTPLFRCSLQRNHPPFASNWMISPTTNSVKGDTTTNITLEQESVQLGPDLTGELVYKERVRVV